MPDCLQRKKCLRYFFFLSYLVTQDFLSKARKVMETTQKQFLQQPCSLTVTKYFLAGLICSIQHQFNYALWYLPVAEGLDIFHRALIFLGPEF